MDMIRRQICLLVKTKCGSRRIEGSSRVGKILLRKPVSIQSVALQPGPETNFEET